MEMSLNKFNQSILSNLIKSFRKDRTSIQNSNNHLYVGGGIAYPA